MKLTFLRRSEIGDIDILDNLIDETEAILLYNKNGADWWIEITGDGFMVDYIRYFSIIDAISSFEKFIFENE